MTNIAVIIPTHNRPSLLKEAIASLMHQSLQPSEIIVIDDASVPPVNQEALQKEFNNTIRVLRNTTPHGLAWVRHQGVEASNSDYITHLDDDDLLAPEALEEGIHLLASDTSIEIVFLGVEGFGKRADYFNNALRNAVASVIMHGKGEAHTDNIVHFNADLLNGLLRSTPMPFQRVMLRKKLWDDVSTLRRRAYCLDPDISNEESARRRISGPLRDSEWSLYAGAFCKHTALLNHPLYLQRCDGQGMTSQPDQKEGHIKQNILIKEYLFLGSQQMDEFRPWKSSILNSMTIIYFDAAYYYFYHGNRLDTWRFLGKSFLTQPKLSHARFFVRTWFPRQINIGVTSS